MRVFLLCLFLLVAWGAAAENRPQVMGYGVKSCEAYSKVYQGSEQGREEQIAEYLRYQDWLTGIVTGLSLATAMDVLQGVEVRSAMRRIELYCDEHPSDDFFTAAMDLIRTLSSFD